MELYQFICTQLQARESLCPQRLGPLVSSLIQQQKDLLAFVEPLENDLQKFAPEWSVPLAQVRAILQLPSWSKDDPRRLVALEEFRQQLGSRYELFTQAVQRIKQSVVRASSVVENLNSRLRNYFTLRRVVGKDYLVLLQFYLNHRRFPRSERKERVGKSPRELLTGESHVHWLELLGYQRFQRN